jgi:hypothetical protein
MDEVDELADKVIVPTSASASMSSENAASILRRGLPPSRLRQLTSAYVSLRQLEALRADASPTNEGELNASAGGKRQLCSLSVPAPDRQRNHPNRHRPALCKVVKLRIVLHLGDMQPTG